MLSMKKAEPRRGQTRVKHSTEQHVHTSKAKNQESSSCRVEQPLCTTALLPYFKHLLTLAIIDPGTNAAGQRSEFPGHRRGLCESARAGTAAVWRPHPGGTCAVCGAGAGSSAPGPACLPRLCGPCWRSARTRVLRAATRSSCSCRVLCAAGGACACLWRCSPRPACLWRHPRCSGVCLPPAASRRRGTGIRCGPSIWRTTTWHLPGLLSRCPVMGLTARLK